MIGVADYSGNPEYGRYAAEKVAKEQMVRDYNDFLVKFNAEHETVHNVYEEIGRSEARFPVALDLVPCEDVELTDIIKSENEELEKVVLALSYLVSEIDFLMSESVSFYYPLMYYGEGVEAADFQGGESHACVGRSVETLQKLLNFVNHTYRVFSNLVTQLSKLYFPQEHGPKYLDIGTSHLKIVYERMGSILATLVTLDCIVNQNNLLREHVAQFQHVIRSITHNASTFDTTAEDLRLMDASLDEITEKILSGNIFLRCVSQNFPTNKTLMEEISINIKGCLEELSYRLEKQSEKNNAESHDKFMSIVCLHVLHAHMGLNVDKKQLKLILDIAKNSIPAVPLKGHCLWFPEQFLSLYLPKGNKAVDAKTRESFATVRMNHLKQITQSLMKETVTWNTKILLWLSKFNNQVSTQEEMIERCCLLLQGLRFLAKLNATVRLILNLHLAIQPTISKAAVLSVFHAIENVKVIESTLEKQMVNCPQAWMNYEQQLRRSVLEMIRQSMKRHAAEKRPSRNVSDALKMAEDVLSGPCTAPRVRTSRLVLALTCRAFRDEELALLAQRLVKMELVASGIRNRLASLADCEVLYWHKHLFTTYLNEARKFEGGRLSSVLRAAFDCEKALNKVVHLKDASRLVESHREFIRGLLERQFLAPLCTDVETELRVQSHANLNDRNPLKEPNGCPDTFAELAVGGDQTLNVPIHVEHYLGETFYNLAALASHDWRKYGQMRLLAGLVFQLNPLPDRLPCQTLEQGLDVLEIMRNIHLFVARFGYNLNNQFFVELSSNSKHLSTIGIKHAANSIRTHGSGVVNTAVNFTYQFLRKKFFIFSQFLYDEHIKSRLMKDARHLRELAGDSGNNKTTATAMRYPYERAEKFHRGIRKLGLNAIGQSYLDQFRLLVTHVGNALGYVRMLRSGSIHCSAESCAPVPDLAELVALSETNIDQLGSTASSVKNSSSSNNIQDNQAEDGLFETLAKNNAHLSQWSVESSRYLDRVLDDLAHNLSESSDYFKILVDVFKPFSRDGKNAHLRHFYLIVPPLTVNYAEHIVTSKEKLAKKNRNESSTFTDDGLAMGLAYCLTVLDEWKEFDALQWFASVREFFTKEKQSAASQPGASQETISLKIHRLNTYQQEFDLLYYNLKSARIFFRHTNDQ